MRNSNTKRLNLKTMFLFQGLMGIFTLCLLFPTPSKALTYSVPIFGNTVGQIQHYTAREGDTILDIAYHFDIGMHEILAANPRLSNRRGGLAEGTQVIIPSRFQLPRTAAREGIVLNLAEMRVYYYHGGKVSTYPVGIGRAGWSTPLGRTTVVWKEKNPTWNPPPSIMREAAARGKRLHAVPPGPNNPLGPYAMHLGFKNILMHGTNQPSSIGLRSSHGCIRLHSRDITELFAITPVGTPVRVIYEPVR